MSIMISVPEIYSKCSTVEENKKLSTELISKKTIFIPVINRECDRLHLKYAFLALSIYFCVISSISQILDLGLFQTLNTGDSVILKVVFTIATFFSGLSFGCGISI